MDFLVDTYLVFEGQKIGHNGHLMLCFTAAFIALDLPPKAPSIFYSRPKRDFPILNASPKNRAYLTPQPVIGVELSVFAQKPQSATKS